MLVFCGAKLFLYSHPLLVQAAESVRQIIFTDNCIATKYTRRFPSPDFHYDRFRHALTNFSGLRSEAICQGTKWGR